MSAGPEDLLDRLALAAGNLAAQPRSSAARRQVRQVLAIYAARRRVTAAQRELQRLADAADAEARQAAGWRADIDG